MVGISPSLPGPMKYGAAFFPRSGSQMPHKMQWGGRRGCYGVGRGYSNANQTDIKPTLCISPSFPPPLLFLGLFYFNDTGARRNLHNDRSRPQWREQLNASLLAHITHAMRRRYLRHFHFNCSVIGRNRELQ